MPLEFFFLGTGTSSGVPTAGCLTDPKGCYTCLSTLAFTHEKHAVNVTHDQYAVCNTRRNTSGILLIPQKTGQAKTLLIDCGKTFYPASLEWWPKKGLRKIDALLLTHPHADAILGLDDLRSWTLHGSVQKTIQIYCTQSTFKEIDRTFPYLTDTKKATGGGDVPAFEWKIFKEKEAIDILGVNMLPFLVDHGTYFTTPPKPYPSLGFLFNSEFMYMSDASKVPDSTWELLSEQLFLTSNEDSFKPKVKALVIDCLRIEPHLSHFGFPQAIEVARRLASPKTYLIGFGHRKSHSSWVSLCEAFENNQRSPLPDPKERNPVTKPSHLVFGGCEDASKEDFQVTNDYALRNLRAWEGGDLGGFWVRPTADGMTITIGKTVTDDLYK